MLDHPHVLVSPYLTVHDERETRIRILVNGFKVVLQRAQRGRPSEAVVIVSDVGRDISFLHRVNNRLYVAVVERHRVGQRRRAVRGQRDRRGASAASRNHAKQGLVELSPSSTVKPLDAVVLQDLFNNVFDRELRQVVELAAVRNGVAGLGDGQRALDNREIGFGHGVRFGEHRTGSGDVRENVPREQVALFLALLTDVMDVGELTEFDERLHGSAQHVGKLAAIHKATQ